MSAAPISSTAGTDTLDLASVPYDPELEGSFWPLYRPRIVEFLDRLQERESWTLNDLSGATADALVRLVRSLYSAEAVAREGMPTLVRVLAALPFRQCIFTLFWLDVHRDQTVREVLRWTLDQRASNAQANASANILWQRIERVARFHVLEDLTAQLLSERPTD